MATATLLMPHDDTAPTASQLVTLRTELKQWEKTFAAANGGRKAGRHDIKQDVHIAAKYKIYSRLKALDETQSQSQVEAHESQHHQSKSSYTTKRKHPPANDDEQTQKSPRTGIFTPRKGRTSRHDYHHHVDPLITATTTIATPSHPKSRPNNHPSQLDPYDSPSTLRRLFNTPGSKSKTYHRSQSNVFDDDFYHSQSQSPLPLKTVIGPTPQRDGKSLGLFDLLSVSGGSRKGGAKGDVNTITTTATPSDRQAPVSPANNKDLTRTPSRSIRRKELGSEKSRDGDDQDEDEILHIRLGRTPTSSSKRFYLEKLFATPTTLRFATLVEDYGDQPLRGRVVGFGEGDSSVGLGNAIQRAANVDSLDENKDDSLESNTPPFLRRSSSGRYLSVNDVTKNRNPTSGMVNRDGNGRTGNGFPYDLNLSPVTIRKPGPRFVGKGLSVLVQGLRDMENERLDENWDILREIEEEEEATAANAAKAASKAGETEVNDSQVAIGTDTNGNRRPYKKKGQKRTTRLVRMKPLRHKPKQPPTTTSLLAESAGNEDSHDEQDESEDKLAPPVPASMFQSITDEQLEKEIDLVPESNLPEFNVDGESGSESDNHDDEDDLDIDYIEEENYARLAQPSSPKLPMKFTDKIKAALAAVKSAPQSSTNNNEQRKPITSKKRTRAATNINNEKKDCETEKKAKTTARKINPLAHANYRSLKIRKKGSGKGRFGGGRFGRRR